MSTLVGTEGEAVVMAFPNAEACVVVLFLTHWLLGWELPVKLQTWIWRCAGWVWFHMGVIIMMLFYSMIAPMSVGSQKN